MRMLYALQAHSRRLARPAFDVGALSVKELLTCQRSRTKADVTNIVPMNAPACIACALENWAPRVIIVFTATPVAPIAIPKAKLLTIVERAGMLGARKEPSNPGWWTFQHE